VRPDQLVFEIAPADEERVVGDARSPEEILLPGVAETAHACVREAGGEPADRVRTSDRQDRDTLRLEVYASKSRESVERELVAETFDEHHRACGVDTLERAGRRLRTAARDWMLPLRHRAA
jgi:hypothetical protein